MRHNNLGSILSSFRNKTTRTIVLILALSLTALPITAWQSALITRTVGPNSAQEPNQNKGEMQTPAPSPSASPTPILTRSSATTRTLAELQTRIDEVLQQPALAPALVAVKVTSLDTGRVLFEENGLKLLRPASNMKLYTVAAALDNLSPNYRFTTSIYASSHPDAAGTVKDDLIIYGRGDPSLGARFNNGDYFKAIDDLANKIVAAGVKRVEGDLVGDESHFVGPKYGSGWEWEDLTWYYGAEISALTVNDNALDLFVKPGAIPGAKAIITTGPPDPLLTIINQVTTGEKSSKRALAIHRELGKDVITVSGSIAVNDPGYTGAVGISHPALLFVYLLRSSLAKKGVIVRGKSRTIGAESQTLLGAGTTIITSGNGDKLLETNQVEIARLQSPPLSLIAAQTLKPSQNLYTELILRTLGKNVPQPQAPFGEPPRTSEEAGLEVIKTFLKKAGILPESLVLNDGSGLSRDDLVTAEATVQLLTFMNQHPHAEAFRAALPVAGVDGTLRNRMRGTAAEKNVRAKTGSLSSAASLAGYVTTAAGERLAFSIMVNNYTSEVEPRVICIDPITVLLASFAARS